MTTPSVTNFSKTAATLTSVTLAWNAPQAVPAPPPGTEALAGTQNTLPTDPPLQDAAGRLWGMNSAGQITINGVVDTTTSNVTTILYWNHQLYQQNQAGGWWYAGNKTGATAGWIGTTTPITKPFVQAQLDLIAPHVTAIEGPFLALIRKNVGLL